MRNVRYYFSQKEKRDQLFNKWDLITLIIILSLFVMLSWATKQLTTPYHLGVPTPISLDPSKLPGYALRTVLRMGIALLFSLLFTFVFGTWAAKSKRAENLIVPAIDILQSIPVLGFQAIAVVPFILLFPNSFLGPECSAIFAIFTAQAWNMVLGFYQRVKSVPHDLNEAADIFQLSAWRRFWKIEVPFSMQSLLWNTMMSMSAGWFFVVATEAITVANQKISLPGIGSYIALAIINKNLSAVAYSILAMLVVILFYDQLLFRPLLKWSEKFSVDQSDEEKIYSSWFLDILQNTKLLQVIGRKIKAIPNQLFYFMPTFGKRTVSYSTKETVYLLNDRLWNLLVVSIALICAIVLVNFIIATVSLNEIRHVFLLGLATATRIIVLLILSSLLWIPVGVWLGMRPRFAIIAQPIVQFLAAFPANLLFPLVVVFIVRYALNVEIWTTPLMILGSQWYILFNVIAGTLGIPKEVHLATLNFGVTGWQWWKRLALPGIFPYFVTGAITAAGGAWNASIVAEVVTWGSTTLHATGLGAYIADYTTAGDFHRTALGIGVMCIYVLLFNRLLWQPLYRFAEERYQV